MKLVDRLEGAFTVQEQEALEYIKELETALLDILRVVNMQPANKANEVIKNIIEASIDYGD